MIFMVQQWRNPQHTYALGLVSHVAAATATHNIFAYGMHIYTQACVCLWTEPYVCYYLYMYMLLFIYMYMLLVIYMYMLLFIYMYMLLFIYMYIIVFLQSGLTSDVTYI
jgi:hypothetical protein